MGLFHHHDHDDPELAELKQIDADLKELIALNRHPTFLKIHFGGAMPGPVTLDVGQKTTASIQVFDQTGQDMTSKIDFAANPISWTLDNPALDSESATGPDSSNADVITSLAGGTANLQASCLGLTDTEQIINVAPAVPTSIKISFSTPQ